MISRQMPRIRLGNTMGFEEYSEALALTYLSSYNTEAIATSTETAHKRAFAMDAIQVLPNEANQHVGCAVATWFSDDAPRMVVAMPGVSGIAGILDLAQVFGYGTVLDLTGSVYAPFEVRFSSLLARLLLNANFATYKDHPRLTITFTGHSLGAALADLFAAWFKRTRPAADVRCIKFGSPRVGNSRWQNNYDQSIKFASIYNDRDPIYFHPAIPVDAMWVTPLGPAPRLFVRNFVRDNGIMRWQPDEGTFTRSYPSDWFNSEIDSTVFALRTHNFANPWYDHSLKAYRLMMMNYCGSLGDSLNYRFNFLEYNDENEWQNLWRPGTRQWEGLDGFSGGGDYQTGPITSSVAEVVNAPVEPPTIAPIVEETFTPKGPRNPVFGIPVRPSPTLLPRRRIRRTV